LTKEQTESFNKNPRFIGLKFPDVSKPETLEKKYTGKLSTKALSLMIGLLKMDPS
jgi:cyclin-dependent kinase-like